MEDNNRRDEQTLDVEAIVNENNQLKEAYNKLAERYNELNNTWMFNRAHMLFDVLKTDAFSKKIKDKAAKELSGFLYPEPEKKENVEKVKE